MRQSMFTLSGAPCTTSHFDDGVLSIFHLLRSPLSECTFDLIIISHYDIYIFQLLTLQLECITLYTSAVLARYASQPLLVVLRKDTLIALSLYI